MSAITVDLDDVRPAISISLTGEVEEASTPIVHAPPTGKLSIFLSHASSDDDDQEDDELIRAYVSRLWAEDWDSPEDSVYDDA
jgi:hypothetical protein